MKMTVFIAVLATGIVLLSSCEKEIAILNPEYPNVERALWKYYAEFEEEAAKRGLFYDLNDIGVTGEISEIHDPGVAGSCQYGSAINNHVTIDQTYWNRSGELYREFVVFHELGHCALFRGHDESANNAGLCLSIMRSGLGGCRDAYSEQNRTAYLDELFSDD